MSSLRLNNGIFVTVLFNIIVFGYFNMTSVECSDCSVISNLLVNHCSQEYCVYFICKIKIR